MSTSDDPLELIRSVLTTPDATFAFLDASGSTVDSVTKSTTVQFPPSNLTLDKKTPTRLARNKETVASASPPSPQDEPALYFTVEALLFAIQLKDERAGAYLAQAASSGIASIPALDRNGVLEYLLSKRTEWAGVLPLSGSVAPVPTAVKRPYAPNRADIEFVKRLRTTYEIVLRTRSDALRGNAASLNGGAAVSRVGTNKVTDFASFRKTFAANLESARKGSNARAPAPLTRLPGSSQTRRQRAQDPIIVISNSPTSLLNMFNIKQYLEEGIFVPPEEARSKARGVTEMVVTITSTAGARRRILVVDNAEAVNRLGGAAQDPWNRVVAVFTTGQAWQFKTYKWSEPRELFKNVMGVYVRWHNEPQNPNVRDWNVTELQVDRTKRHTDKQVVAFFWRSLETWTQRRKPHLV